MSPTVNNQSLKLTIIDHVDNNNDTEGQQPVVGCGGVVVAAGGGGVRFEVEDGLGGEILTGSAPIRSPCPCVSGTVLGWRDVVCVPASNTIPNSAR